MHVLTVNSVTTLLNYLTDKLKRTPSADIIQKWITEEKVEVTDKKVYPDKLRKFTGQHLLSANYYIVDYTIFCVLKKMGEMLSSFHSIARAYYTHMKWQNKNQHINTYFNRESAHCAELTLSLTGIC